MDTCRDQKNLLRAIFCLVLSIPVAYLIVAATALTRAAVVGLVVFVAWSIFAALGLLACLMGLLIAKSRHRPR